MWRIILNVAEKQNKTAVRDHDNVPEENALNLEKTNLQAEDRLTQQTTN